MNIHIISSGLPPMLDGIGDYTACLSSEIAHSASVTVLTGVARPAPIPGVRIEAAFSAKNPASVQGLLPFVAGGKPDWVLLQYNPFSYGRWGLNLHLPSVVRQIKYRCPSTKIALMVHEPFVPVVTPQFAVMTTWQRWQLWRLGQSADIVFFSIEAWQKKFEPWFPGKPLIHLPVGSNIPVTPISRSEARERLGIAEKTLVLGLFGTASGGRMLERTKDALTALQAANMPVQVLYVGPHKDAIREALGATNVVADGPFPAEEVSRRLSAMDIYLSAYVDGVSTRRGAFLAALQHGIATVGTLGFLTDCILEKEDGHSFLLADVSTPEAFTAAVCNLAENAGLRQSLGNNGRELYLREFVWSSIAKLLLSELNRVSR